MNKFSRNVIERALEQFFTEELIDAIFENLEYLQGEENKYVERVSERNARAASLLRYKGVAFSHAELEAWIEEVEAE